jgi:hypothetical protein
MSNHIAIYDALRYIPVMKIFFLLSLFFSSTVNAAGPTTFRQMAEVFRTARLPVPQDLRVGQRWTCTYILNKAQESQALGIDTMRFEQFGQHILEREQNIEYFFTPDRKAIFSKASGKDFDFYGAIRVQPDGSLIREKIIGYSPFPLSNPYGYRVISPMSLKLKHATVWSYATCSPANN